MLIHELKQVLRYEPNTGLFFWRINRRPKKAGDKAGSLSKDGYVSISRNHYMAHVLAWAFMTGEWPNTDVDHKNNIRNDNRWENLRLATRSQNNANSRRRKKDGFKGVRQKATCKNTWSISLKVCGKTITRSGFRSPEEASKAYMVLATEYFGEFARSG